MSENITTREGPAYKTLKEVVEDGKKAKNLPADETRRYKSVDNKVYGVSSGSLSDYNASSNVVSNYYQESKKK